MTSVKPNLFSYATSELSQDAVICWMLDWINYNESEMKNFAIDFIDEMFKLHHKYSDLSARDIEKLVIRKQYKNIDILVEIYFKTAERLDLIIEDKTNSIEHSNQLAKYRDIIENQPNEQEHNLGTIGIY